MTNRFYKRLTYSLSFTLPILVVSGVLFSLSFLINPPLGQFLFDVGNYAYYLSYAVLAAAIAYAIGDRVSIVPALIGGFMLFDGSVGLLGSVVIGFFAGYLTKALLGLFPDMPKTLLGIFTVFVYPVLLTVMTLGLAFLMNQYLSMPLMNVIAFLFYDHHWLVITLSVILASLMAFDLGGPVNKMAYLIAIMTLANGLTSTVMAAVIAGGMVPPLVVAVIRIFNHREEDERWWITAIQGLSFLSEGAISFVDQHKKYMTPIMMIGSGLAGGVVGWFSLSTRIPHGGILVAVFMDAWYYFLLALVIGMVTTFILLAIFNRKIKRKKTSETPLQV